MKDVLKKYLPERAVQPTIQLIQKHRVQLQIVGQRKTRHGDYRKLPTGQVKITVNASLNQYKVILQLTIHTS